MNAKRLNSIERSRGPLARLCDYLSGRAFAGVFLLCVFVVSPLFAQTPPFPSAYPRARCFICNGAANHFSETPIRKITFFSSSKIPISNQFARRSQRTFFNGSKRTVPPRLRCKLADLISLLDNPAAFGFMASPQTSGVGPSNPSHLASLFFVYDATGKADLVQKLKTVAQASSKTKPAISTYTFGGSTIEVRTENPERCYQPKHDLQHEGGKLLSGDYTERCHTGSGDPLQFLRETKFICNGLAGISSHPSLHWKGCSRGIFCPPPRSG